MYLSHKLYGGTFVLIFSMVILTAVSRSGTSCFLSHPGILQENPLARNHEIEVLFYTNLHTYVDGLQ